MYFMCHATIVLYFCEYIIYYMLSLLCVSTILMVLYTCDQICETIAHFQIPVDTENYWNR